MNPTIEVQILARIDQLDAGLKAAEAKIGTSAKNMGKSGEAGGSAFIDSMKNNIVKGLAMGAIANVLEGGLLNLVKGINAGKSGEEIGMSIAQGIVDGAKSIPIVGGLVSLVDEMVNGANRALEALQASVATAQKNYVDAWGKMTEARNTFLERSKARVEDIAVSQSPEGMIQLAADREMKRARQLAETAKATAASDSIMGLRAAQELQVQGASSDDLEALRTRQAAEREMNEKVIASNALLIDKQLAQELIAIETDKNNKLKALSDAADAEKLAKETAAAEKLASIQKAAEVKALHDQEKAEKEKKAAIDKANKEQEQANKAFLEKKKADEEAANENRKKAIAKIEDEIALLEQKSPADKAKELFNMATTAAQGMMHSGQTAIGQFNFAESGAQQESMRIAKEQSMKLDEIARLHDTVKQLKDGQLG
jgi:hypothetical protein